VNGASAIARTGDLLLAANRVSVAGLISAGGGIDVQAARQASLSGRASAPTGGLTVTTPQASFGSLDARDTRVTLDLGAEGNATGGALDAGGLTVRGGTGATLTGTVAGVGGGAAAALGSRATTEGAPLSEPLPQPYAFTFNGCPIGAVLCLPLAGLTTVPLTSNPGAVMAVLEPAYLVPFNQILRLPDPLPVVRSARDRSEQDELAPLDVRRGDY
jgi:hypothetical protein